MEKEIIEQSKEIRRDMAEFHKLVKFSKKQSEIKPYTVTITKVCDQIVFMGNGSVIDSMDNKTAKMIREAFKDAENDTTFSTSYQVNLPKLFADLRLLKEKKIWTSKMMQAQALTYFCVLGFGVGGFRSFDDEEEPDFWPDKLTWNEYSHPSDETMAVNEAVVRAILEFYDYNPDEHFNDLEVPEGVKKKQNRRQTDKRNKRIKTSRDDEDIAEDVPGDVSPSNNNTNKGKAQKKFEQERGKKNVPKPLIDDIEFSEAEDDGIENNSDLGGTNTESEDEGVKQDGHKKEIYRTKYEQVTVKKKATEPLIGDIESSEAEDWSDLEGLDTESENECNKHDSSEGEDNGKENHSDFEGTDTESGNPRTKYDQYLAGKDYGWTAGDANGCSNPSPRPKTVLSPSSSIESRSSTKSIPKQLAPAKRKSRFQKDGTDKNNIIEGPRKRKTTPIDWDYEYSL